MNLTPKAFLPAQEEARSLVEDVGGPKYVLLSGGQGSGKTYWGCWQLLRVHFMNLQHVLRSGGSADDVKSLILSPTHSLLKKGLGFTLESVLAEAGLAGRYTWNRQDGILRFDFGGAIYFFTAEKPELIVSVDVSQALIDEPGTPKRGDAFFRVQGRLRGPGLRRVVIMAGTPEDIVSRDWFYEFIASPDAQHKYGAAGDNTRRVVFAATQDNTFIEDLEGYVAGQKAVLTQQQQQAYLYGQFVAFNVGRVYSAYIDRPLDAGGHMVRRGDPMLAPPGRGNELLIGLDFNVNPMCGVIGWNVGGKVLIADEVRIPNAGGEGTTPITRWCDEVVRRWVGAWSGPVLVYGDATEKRQTVAASTTGWSLVHGHLRPIVEASGWDYRSGVPFSNPRELDRVNSLNAGFEQDRIMVSEDCVHLRKDLNLVGWKEGTNEVDKTTDKNLTHLSDGLGYLWTQHTGLIPRRNPGARMPDVLTISTPAFSERADW